MREHAFDNLIALCPTCHTRFDRGDIDRLSVRQYKTNLAILNSRYSEFERRVLTVLGKGGDGTAPANMVAGHAGAPMFGMPGGMEIFVMNLLADKIVVKAGYNAVFSNGVPSREWFAPTDEGQAFLKKLADAESIDDEDVSDH